MGKLARDWYRIVVVVDCKLFNWQGVLNGVRKMFWWNVGVGWLWDIVVDMVWIRRLDR